MSFVENAKRALVTYKIDHLGIKEAGYYKHRGRFIPKKHILPLDCKKQNIIQQYRKAFYDSPKSDIHFHQYFHHLNSSQALCINLFFPLIAETKLNLILDLLKIQEQPVTESCFEKESDMEMGSGRRTNFDFYMKLADGTKIYFETKYTELEFGKATNDDEHNKKYQATYKPLVKSAGYINSAYKDVEKFLESYQIMRNLCHITDHSFVVFVYPAANQKIDKQAQEAKEKILTDKGKNKFKILTLESTVSQLLMNTRGDAQAHFKEFQRKHLTCHE